MSKLQHLILNRGLAREHKLKENMKIIHPRRVHIGYGTKNWFWYAFYNVGISSRWVIRTKPQSSLVALLAHEHFFIFICLFSFYFLFFTPSTRKLIIYSHLSHTKTLGERGTLEKRRRKIQFQLSFFPKKKKKKQRANQHTKDEAILTKKDESIFSLRESVNWQIDFFYTAHATLNSFTTT